MNIDDHMSKKPAKPNKVERMKKIHTSTEWMFHEQAAAILKECIFEIPASGVKSSKDLLEYTFVRYIVPTLKRGDELIPTVASKKGTNLVVVNFEKYRVVQTTRALDTLLEVLTRNGCSIFCMAAYDEKTSMVVAMTVDMANEEMHTRAVKILWKESEGRQVAEQLLDQRLPAHEIVKFFLKFGMVLSVDATGGLIKG